MDRPHGHKGKKTVAVAPGLWGLANGKRMGGAHLFEAGHGIQGLMQASAGACSINKPWLLPLLRWGEVLPFFPHLVLEIEPKA